MPSITIKKLGPIDFCELELKDFIIFTGAQASGKSTVAKSVFFFKNIKNLMLDQVRKRILYQAEMKEKILDLTVKKSLIREIRSNFLQTFGSTWCMDSDMFLRYDYAPDVWIEISLISDPVSPNYIWIEFSQTLSDVCSRMEDDINRQKETEFQNSNIKEKIFQVFHDEAEVIYIPAGRSMITLLSTQLNYIYGSMDDLQKRNIDYCTQNYLERILKLKVDFSQSADQMIRDFLRMTDLRIDKKLLYAAAELMKCILKGEYRNVNGEERLQVSQERYIKINFASSGQQESVWILNVLFYYLLNNRKSYFIIEEPESHLFPNAQKLMTQFISLCRGNGRNQVFITTHSPYILGTINNLLYADKISGVVDKELLNEIISEDQWIAFSSLCAFYMKNGKALSCTDDEFCSIENEIIDGASEEINEDYDKMVTLKANQEYGG